MRYQIRAVLTFAAIAAVAGAATACSAETPERSDTSTEVTYLDANGQCSDTPLEGIDLERAQANVTAYQTKPDRVAVDESLPSAPDSDTSVVVVDNGAAVGTLLAGFLEEASKAAGVKFMRVAAGTDAQSVNTALNSVLEMKPDIVVAPALDPSFYIDQLGSLRDSGTVFVTPAIINAADFDLTDSYIGHGSSLEYGRMLASAAVALSCGTTTDFVYYGVPELPPSQLQLEALTEELDVLCAECNLRVVDIPIANLDTGASDAVISDLQAHPETDFFIAAADQIQVGLAAKQELAGLDVPGMGMSSLPANIEQVNEGTQIAGVVTDYEYMAWLFLDEGLRAAAGLDMTDRDWAALNPMFTQVATAANVDDYLGANPVYDGFKADLTELWGR